MSASPKSQTPDKKAARPDKKAARPDKKAAKPDKKAARPEKSAAAPTCTMCKESMAFVSEEGEEGLQMYKKTSCGHNLCPKCCVEFMAAQSARHRQDVKIPWHKCHLCGTTNLRVSYPDGWEFGLSHPPFIPADECTIYYEPQDYDESGTELHHEFPDDLLKAIKKLEASKVKLIDIVSIMLYKNAGTDALGSHLPYSMKRFNEISDIIDQIDL